MKNDFKKSDFEQSYNNDELHAPIFLFVMFVWEKQVFPECIVGSLHMMHWRQPGDREAHGSGRVGSGDDSLSLQC